MIKDIEGEFEIRGKTICSAELPNAPEEYRFSYTPLDLTFILDKTPPIALRTYQPDLSISNGKIVSGSVMFTEGINCAKVAVASVTSSACGGDGTGTDEA